MSQTRQVAAQQAQMDSRTLERVRSDLVTQITAIRQLFTSMQSSGIPSVQADYQTSQVATLLNTLSTNATALGIPITGTTPQERFRSLNDWLNASWSNRAALSGRNRDSPLTPAAMDELDLRLQLANDRLVSNAAAQADVVLGGMRGATPVPVQQQVTPQAQQVAPTPQLTGEAAFMAQYASLMADLQYIQSNSLDARGRPTAQATQAGQYRTQLQTLFRARRPNQAQIDRLVAQANTFAYGADGHSGAMASSITQANTTSIRVNQGAQHPLSSQATDLLTSLQAMTDPLATRIAQRVPDIWLLGDNELRSMLNFLVQARDALRAGNSTQAQSKLDEAAALFTREQQLYARLLEQYVVPISTSSVAAIDGSVLPRRADLTTAQTRDRASHVTYLLRGTTRSSLQNGREDLHNIMQGRADRANTLLANRARGLSYREVADLYQSATIDEQAISTLISMWEYARQNGLDTLDTASRTSFWLRYATAAMAIADPSFNVFNSYSREQQRRSVEIYLNRLPGSTISADDYQRGAREVAALLMQNRQYRYDDVLYGVYLEVVARAPSSGESYVQNVAAVRSVRPIIESQYFGFLSGNPELPSELRSLRESDPERVPRINRYRLEQARTYLDMAIRAASASGMPDSDAVLTAARAWYTATTSRDADHPAVPNDRLVATADAIYMMALDLSTIREAEIWAANSGLRPPNLSSDAVTQAGTFVQLARTEFLWNFSSTTLDPTYHPNGPRNAANAAIRMLAPPALVLTEGPAMYATTQGYGNPERFITLSGDATDADRLRGAAAADQRYISFLMSLRSSPLFGATITERTLRSTDLFGPRTGLHFILGRTPPTMNVGSSQFPSMEIIQMRRRPTISVVDQHQVPTANPLDAGTRSLMHEELGLGFYGQVYSELYRQTILHHDSATPELLRGLDVAPDSYPVRRGTPYQQQDERMKARLQEIARNAGLPTDQPFLSTLGNRMLEVSASYASRTGPQVQQDMNRLVLAYLDARISELEARLSGQVILADGRPVAVESLLRSRGPRGAAVPGVYYVTRAREALEQARRLRTQFGSGTADLFSGGLSPRDAIAIAEMGLESLTDDGPGQHTCPSQGHLTCIPRPAPLPTAAFRVISVDQRAGWVRDEQWSQFTANVTATTGTGGGAHTYSLPDYESSNGRQNLTYYWIFYSDISGRGDYMVINPRHHDAGHEGEGHYSGMVMRGIRTQDGRTVDAVVRVRAPGDATRAGGSRTIEWEPVRDGNNNYDILYEIQPGSGGNPPFVPVSLSTRARDLCVMQGGRTASVHVVAPTQATVVLEQNQ